MGDLLLGAVGQVEGELEKLESALGGEGLVGGVGDGWALGEGLLDAVDVETAGV